MKDDGVDRFPLLRLPENVKLLIVKHMDLHDAFKLSFLSKRAMHLLQQRNLRENYVEVKVTSSICIEGQCWIWDPPTCIRYEIKFPEYDNRKHFLDSKNLNPRCQIFSSGTNYEICPAFKIKRGGYGFEDYLNHCLTLTKAQNVDILTFKQEVQNLEEFRRIIPKIWKLKILDLFPDNSIQDVLRLFVPNVLQIDREYANIEHHLISNLDRFMTAFPWNLTLENLLSMNARDIEMTVHQFSAIDLNRFLKLWMKGSNRRLKHLELKIRNSPKLEKGRIWKGIKYEVQPDKLMRYFRYARTQTYGGFDIKRKDGTLAIINTDEHTFFNMYVIANNIYHDIYSYIMN
ncbi:unnamed protein product [Caenorhabditis nigoni]